MSEICARLFTIVKGQMAQPTKVGVFAAKLSGECTLLDITGPNGRTVDWIRGYREHMELPLFLLIAASEQSSKSDPFSGGPIQMAMHIP